MEDPGAFEPLPDDLQQVRNSCLDFLYSEAHGNENWEILRGGAACPGVFQLQVARFKGKRWDDSNIVCMRGKLRFHESSPQEILDLIVKLDERPNWDQMMESGEVRKVYSSSSRNSSSSANSIDGDTGCDIAHLQYRGVPCCSTVIAEHLAHRGVPHIVDKRDLCLFRWWATEHATQARPMRRVVLVAQSVEHGAIPEVSGSVRADLMECGYLMEEGKAGTGTFTDVTYINSLDFKGSIPASFTNIVLMQQPETLEAMVEILQKPDPSHPNCKSTCMPEGEKECRIM